MCKLLETRQTIKMMESESATNLAEDTTQMETPEGHSSSPPLEMASTQPATPPIEDKPTLREPAWEITVAGKFLHIRQLFTILLAVDAGINLVLFVVSFVWALWGVFFWSKWMFLFISVMSAVGIAINAITFFLSRRTQPVVTVVAFYLIYTTAKIFIYLVYLLLLFVWLSWILGLVVTPVLYLLLPIQIWVASRYFNYSYYTEPKPAEENVATQFQTQEQTTEGHT